MTSSTTMIELRRSELRFPALAEGSPDGDLLLLLHGFPQTSACWEGIAARLAGPECYAVAPTQRGYASSARPPGRSAYALDELVADVIAMADDLDRDRFDLVGHDWGGVVAWAVAAAHPERVRSLSVLAMPHPAAMVDVLWRSTQALRSAYAAFFQLPVVPERLLLARGGWLLSQALRRSGLPGAWVERYKAVLGSPAALSGALAWYRATSAGRFSAIGPIEVPTLYIWPEDDVALGPAAAHATERHVTGPYRFVSMPDQSHWLPETAADEVADLIEAHLAECGPREVEATRSAP